MVKYFTTRKEKYFILFLYRNKRLFIKRFFLISKAKMFFKSFSEIQ